MQARFLLGPAGSGKTFRCLAEIRRALLENPEGPPLILLAPKQATFQLERQLLADGSLAGYTRLRILSFERLAQFVFDTLRVPLPKLLDEEGRVMVLRALLMRHEGELKLFRKSARRPGFARQLSDLLRELQQHQFTFAKLRTFSQRPNLSPELSDKLHDLALLLDAYSGWLVERGLQDANRLLDAATTSLKSKVPSPKSRDGANAGSFEIQNSGFKIGSLWLDGFAEMTPQELDLLAAVLPFCENATLAFCLDEAGVETDGGKTSWLSVWSAVHKSFQECWRRLGELPDCKTVIEQLKRDPVHNRFAQNPALCHLEEHWTCPNPISEILPQSGTKFEISLVTCANPDAEATFAAREILHFVRDRVRYRDVAVLVRNLDAYHKPLARAFRRYEIPFFLDRRESVSHHPLAELTRSALRTVAFDWAHEDWFAALKTGFAPAEEKQIDDLENEALARGWRGAKWREPIQISDKPERAAWLENLRKELVPPFAELAAQIAANNGRPTGPQLAGAIRKLWDRLKIEKTLEQWGLAGTDQSTPTNPQSAIHSTVWDQMNTWLDNVELAFPQEALPLRDWLLILEAGLANLTVGVIPPALDQVLIGAIDRTRNPDLKLALVLGLNEGVFPAAPAAPLILTDADRETMSDCGAAIGPDLHDRLARERYYGYIACTRPSERLVLTYSSHDGDGKTLNPSPFVFHLQRLFPQLDTEEFHASHWHAAEHISELILPLMQMQNAKSETENWKGLIRLPALASLAEALKQLRHPSPKESLSYERAVAIYGPTLLTSVSQLEQFAACPFRFFIHAGLHAKERELFELDFREQGSFQHDVLKIFHEQLISEGRRWRDLTPAEAREWIGKIANALAATFRDGLLHDNEQSRFTARMLTESLQDFIEVITGWLREKYDFDPAAVEIAFGGDDATVPPWTLDLGDGKRLALRGRIDRVDLWREPGGDRAFAVVIDYKSSEKKLDAVLVEHGVQLQLPAYLNVLRHWANPTPLLGVARLTPTGVFYVNLRGRYERSSTRAEALADPLTARRAAYKHTGRFDAGILSKLDRSGASQGEQFNFRLNQDGTLRKGSAEALEHAEFVAMLDRIEKRLRQMGREIFAGEAKVDPYRKGKTTACDFCDCRAICRIDPWTHNYRVLEKIGPVATRGETP